MKCHYLGSTVLSNKLLNIPKQKLSTSKRNHYNMEQTDVKSFLEFLRDFVLLYSNFLQEITSLQKEHNIPDIQSYLSTINATDLPKSLSLLPLEQFQKVYNVLYEIDSMRSLKNLKNPLELSHNERLALINKLNMTVRDLEQIVGVSKTTQIPTDLDSQLMERCRDKDYHDIISNAFSLLEDRIRHRVGADTSYYGTKLIDYAFSPKSGKLSLGDTDAEKEGAYLLFKGAMQFLRNPPAHTLTVAQDRNAGLKIIYMTDLLLKLLDKAKDTTS